MPRGASAKKVPTKLEAPAEESEAEASVDKRAKVETDDESGDSQPASRTGTRNSAPRGKRRSASEPANKSSAKKRVKTTGKMACLSCNKTDKDWTLPLVKMANH